MLVVIILVYKNKYFATLLQLRLIINLVVYLAVT